MSDARETDCTYGCCKAGDEGIGLVFVPSPDLARVTGDIIRPQNRGSTREWNHYGCPMCGNVWKIPGSRDEAPYCWHGDHYSWQDHSTPDDPWTHMVPVIVYTRQTTNKETK